MPYDGINVLEFKKQLSNDASCTGCGHPKSEHSDMDDCCYSPKCQCDCYTEVAR